MSLSFPSISSASPLPPTNFSYSIESVTSFSSVGLEAPSSSYSFGFLGPLLRKTGTSLRVLNSYFSYAFSYIMKPGLGSAIGLFWRTNAKLYYRFMFFLLIR